MINKIDKQEKFLNAPPKDPDWRRLIDKLLRGNNRIGDDKYDEAGEVVNYLMRDAGEDFSTAKELYKAGNIKSGAVHITKGLIKAYMAFIVGRDSL